MFKYLIALIVVSLTCFLSSNACGGFLDDVVKGVVKALEEPATEETAHSVTKVIDGDTVIIDEKVTIRLIGIDTPELHHPQKPVMYFAEQAHEFVKELCEGKKVKVEYDEANAVNKHLDKYGRTLAYLYLEDGTFINAEIVKQGYGFCYVNFPFKYMEEFRTHQREAMESERGLWAKQVHDQEISNLIM